MIVRGGSSIADRGWNLEGSAFEISWRCQWALVGTGLLVPHACD
jgi:hypothetical protein